MKRWQFGLSQLIGRVLLIVGIVFQIQGWSYGVEVFVLGFIVMLFSLLYIAPLVLRTRMMKNRQKVIYLSIMFVPTFVVFLLVRDETWVKYMCLAVAIMLSNAITLLYVYPKLFPKQEDQN